MNHADRSSLLTNRRPLGVRPPNASDGLCSLIRSLSTNSLAQVVATKPTERTPGCRGNSVVGCGDSGTTGGTPGLRPGDGKCRPRCPTFDQNETAARRSLLVAQGRVRGPLDRSLPTSTDRAYRFKRRRKRKMPGRQPFRWTNPLHPESLGNGSRNESSWRWFCTPALRPGSPTHASIRRSVPARIFLTSDPSMTYISTNDAWHPGKAALWVRSSLTEEGLWQEATSTRER